jgi:hypothetical protein
LPEFRDCQNFAIVKISRLSGFRSVSGLAFTLGGGELLELLLAHRFEHGSPLSAPIAISPRLAASAAPAAIC